jgi:hypothetical protein
MFTPLRTNNCLNKIFKFIELLLANYQIQKLANTGDLTKKGTKKGTKA